MNPNIKIYEPLLEPTTISFKFKGSLDQVEIRVNKIRLLISYEMIIDGMK